MGISRVSNKNHKCYRCHSSGKKNMIGTFGYVTIIKCDMCLGSGSITPEINNLHYEKRLKELNMWLVNVKSEADKKYRDRLKELNNDHL